MTTHQKRIFRKMIAEIKNYPQSKELYSQFVANLEGLFEAAEVKNENLIESWYKHWTPLEVANGYYAGTGQNPPISELEKDLIRFSKFLENLLISDEQSDN